MRLAAYRRQGAPGAGLVSADEVYWGHHRDRHAGGCGIGFKPPKSLQAGDRVRIEIDGIAVLENMLRAQ